jgi:hypothetical protein
MPPEQREHIAQGVKRARKRGYAPQLPKDHGLSARAVKYHSMLWRCGYAHQGWDEADKRRCFEMLRLMDDWDAADSAALRARLGEQIDAIRGELGITRAARNKRLHRQRLNQEAEAHQRKQAELAA